MLTLRSYQQTSVDAVRNEFIQRFSAPMLVLPTGGGKTVIFCHIAQQTASNEKRVLILVHRVELLRQTSAALTKSSVRHGLINPNYTPNLRELVQVASVQTVSRRLDKIPPPDLIVIDECHHAIAGQWKKVVDYFPNARVLGVTATPVRGDGKGLGVDSGGVFDTMVEGPTIAELIEMGYLVAPKVYGPGKKVDFSSVKITRGDYDKKQVVEIMDKPTITGDAVEHYSRICPGVPAVAFCVSVEHAQHVANEFRNKGFRAYSVDGSMDDDTRTRILDGLGNGSIDIVTSCDLISEGTDIPAIGCAILLRPTKSLGLYIQQVGRALRPSPGKEYALILDHVGNVFRHGFPESSREWSLDGEVKNKRSKRNNDDETKVVQCESCFACYEPAPICPFCGCTKEAKKREVEQIEGELQLLEQSRIESEKEQAKKAARLEVARARTLDELTAIETRRGYGKGWARRVFKSRGNKIV